jgi:hypothetical protein
VELHLHSRILVRLINAVADVSTGIVSLYLLAAFLYLSCPWIDAST